MKIAENKYTTKLYIHFYGDPSVGIFPYSFTMEVPTHSIQDGLRDETLRWVKELYKQLDGEFTPAVYVDGEDIEIYTVGEP